MSNEQKLLHEYCTLAEIICTCEECQKPSEPEPEPQNSINWSAVASSILPKYLKILSSIYPSTNNPYFIGFEYVKNNKKSVEETYLEEAERQLKQLSNKYYTGK